MSVYEDGQLDVPVVVDGIIGDSIVSQLAALRLRRDKLDKEIELAVVRGRGVGLPWARLGDALGITRQAVNQRFAHRAGR